MSRQHTFSFRLSDDQDDPGLESWNAAAWRKVLHAIGRMVAEHASGPKYVADQIGVAHARLDHAIAERERHHVKAEWLPALVVLDEHALILRSLADLAGYDLVAKKPLDAEQELAALKAAIGDELGPSMRATLLAKAHAKAGGQ